MSTSTKKAGLAALLGVGAGVFAMWKYQNLSQEEKDKIKSKVEKTGKKITDTYTEVEDKLSEKFTEIKDKIKQEVEEITN